MELALPWPEMDRPGPVYCNMAGPVPRLAGPVGLCYTGPLPILCGPPGPIHREQEESSTMRPLWCTRHCLVLVAMLSLLLAGCGRSQEAETPTPQPTATLPPTATVAAPVEPTPTLSSPSPTPPATATPPALPAGPGSETIADAETITMTDTMTDTMTGTGTGTVTNPVADVVVLLPTPTPTPAPAGSTQPQAETGPGIQLPDTFRARGTFRTRSTFADGSVTVQQGEFQMAFVRTDSAYGSDESYVLTTRHEDGSEETVAVYQVGDRLAVNYGEGDWLVVQRDQGSAFAAGIQAFVDLSQAIARNLTDAERVGVEMVNGVPAIHYRIDNPGRFATLFPAETAANMGQILSMQYDGWVAQEGGFVVKYDFVAEVRGARTLGPDFQPTEADQSLSWSYEMLDIGADVAVSWPADAPEPGVIQVPGFAPGEFPLPPETELVNYYGGIPELVSRLSEEEVTQFYQDTLTAMGWSVEGSFGFYTCRKGDDSFSLVITRDEASDETRVTILVERP